MLGHGRPLFRLIGLSPLPYQKSATGVRRMKKENAYPFLQAGNIYIRHVGLDAFVDYKRTLTAINKAIPHHSCLIFDFFVF
jgi:hypothetical protein